MRECLSAGEARENQFNEKARLDFEILISEISASLVHLGTEEIDSVINSSLQKILDFLRIDRATLWFREPETKRFQMTHAKIRPGCGPQEISDLTTDSFPWMTEQYLNGRETQYSRIDDLPPEAAVDKESLRRLGPKYSSLAIPLFEGDRVFGIMALGIAEEKIWPEELAPRLRLIANVFSNALIRSRTTEQLRQTLLELEKAKAQYERENVYLRQEMKVRYFPTKMIYQSKAMKEVITKSEQVAATNSSVFLVGETGTGKELIATAIHEMSSRCGRTMVRVNCGAIPSALVESEMFGREKGAYTGALSRQIGRFELAHESTIFLDEITDLPMEVQVKLLRVLQEKEIERLGNPKPIHVDVRVIAATNSSLEKAVQEGKFREDLYYRLNVFPIEIPPLRERKEDIAVLIWSFVEQLSREFGKKVESISGSSMDACMEYSWPGNVRELRNTIERAMIVLNSTKLNIDLPKTTAIPAAVENLTLKDLEIRHIRRVLEDVSWKIRGKKGAAEILGLKPTTLETRMLKLGITRPGSKTHYQNTH
jgi:transcriptional regulator with GAF, ATPase, and Fis domain